MVRQVNPRNWTLRSSKLQRAGIRSLGRWISFLQSLHKELRIEYPLGDGFEAIPGPDHWTINDPRGASISIASMSRAYLYSRGIEARINLLASQYCLEDLQLPAGSLLVDVGANIGELAMWARQKELDYIGFEPDPSVFTALSSNARGFPVFNVALSDEEEERDFYLRTDSADSTLIRPTDWAPGESSLKVLATTLDNALSGIKFPKGPLVIKVEAEGWEPEVLRGARVSISKADFVVVDAGPERNGENTAPQIINFLFAAGYMLARRSNDRETYLFKKVS